jgi:hypothetical protein
MLQTIHLNFPQQVENLRAFKVLREVSSLKFTIQTTHIDAIHFYNHAANDSINFDTQILKT